MPVLFAQSVLLYVALKHVFLYNLIINVYRQLTVSKRNFFVQSEFNFVVFLLSVRFLSHTAVFLKLGSAEL
jgi:hypothetical protein